MAGALVAQRAVDQHEVGCRAGRHDLSRRGDADEQAAAGGEELLGHQHRERGADRTSDDAEELAVLRHRDEIGVVAGPFRQGPGPAGGLQVTHEVAIRIEDADLRHVSRWQGFLPPGFPQQVLGPEHRGGRRNPWPAAAASGRSRAHPGGGAACCARASPVRRRWRPAAAAPPRNRGRRAAGTSAGRCPRGPTSWQGRDGR